MKYIGGKVLDNDGTEMPMYKLNQIVKISEEYASETKKKKYNSKKYKKQYEKKFIESKPKYEVKEKEVKELTQEEIISKLSKNSNLKIIKK